MEDEKIDPFTLTPGVAGKPYIDCGIATEIITNFRSSESSKYVYRITGLRGSGKSVEYNKVLQTLEKDKNWLVYSLSAAGDGVETLLSYLCLEDFVKDARKETLKKADASAEGGISLLSEMESKEVIKTYSANNHYNAEAMLSNMIAKANKKNKNILVMIDDISRTENMVKLLSVLGTMFNRGRRVYLVVSGLAANIEEFFLDKENDPEGANLQKSMSFFRRGDTREAEPLDKFKITEKYAELLNVDEVEAKKLYDLTLGYAYAYQVLGSLFFNKKATDTIENLIPKYERILFQSYNMDWTKMTDVEQDFIRAYYKSGTGKAKDIKAHMKNPQAYNVYRERLLNKHFFYSEKRGFLEPRLPRYDRFIKNMVR